MRHRTWMAALMGLLIPLTAFGQDGQDDTEDRLRRLEQTVQQQQQEIDRLRETTHQESSGSGFEAIWDDGFYIQTKNKEFRLNMGGRIQADLHLAEANHPYENDFLIRRARMHLKGNLYEYFIFKVELAMGRGSAGLQDGYLEAAFLDEIKFRAGQYKEPFGYEQLTSSRYIKFIERSLASDVIAPGHDIGLMLHGKVAEGLFSYAVGAFNGEGRNNVDANDGMDFAFYLGLDPLTQSDNDWLKGLHLGFGLTYGLQDREVGGDDFDTPLLGTEYFEFADDVVHDGDRLRVGGEVAYFGGPFSLVAEVMYMSLGEVELGAVDEDLSVLGWHLYATFMITGEDNKRKRIEPDSPFNPLDDEFGYGAWEVAFRVDQVNIDDDLYDEGLATGVDDALGITIGLNWHLNKFTKVMFNYSRTEFEDEVGVGDGKSRDNEDVFAARFQIEF